MTYDDVIERLIAIQLYKEISIEVNIAIEDLIKDLTLHKEISKNKIQDIILGKILGD